MKVTGIIAITFMTVAVSYAQEDDIVEGNSKFTVKLFKEIIKQKPNQNVIFAPISVQILMALITSATHINGPAIKELIKEVELPSKTKINKTFKDLSEDLNQQSDDFKIFSANKVYFGTDCTVQNWFKNDARNIFKAETEIIDFQYPDNAAGIMNLWVADETNHKIEDFIQEDQISKNTKFFFINALYLFGKWDKPFDKQLTVRDSFYGPKGVKEVDMMKIAGKTYEWYEDKKAQYLQFDFVRKDMDGAAQVIFVLPFEQQGLADLVQNHLDDVFFPHTPEVKEVAISLPKFKFTSDIPLKTSLKNLGVKKIFQNGVILEGYNYHGAINNYVTDVFQKVLIELDETGVTATSAGAGVGVVDAPLKSEKKEFKADHPFLFYIRVADVIVYAGQVLEP